DGLSNNLNFLDEIVVYKKKKRKKRAIEDNNEKKEKEKVEETQTEIKILEELESLAQTKISKVKEMKPSIKKGYTLSNQGIDKIRVIGSELRKLPESIRKLTSLQELELSINNRRRLPESFGNLKSLQKIDLNQNDIKFIPNSMNNLESLIELNLSQNKLEEINFLTYQENKNFQNMKFHMYKIPRSDNQKRRMLLKEALTKIEKQPTEKECIDNSIGFTNYEGEIIQFVRKTKSQWYFDVPYKANKSDAFTYYNIDNLSTTEVKKIVSSFWKDPKFYHKFIRKAESQKGSIGEINLDKIILNDLLESKNKLDSLKKLNLHENELSNIPESIEHLKKLEYLDLSRNKLETLPDVIGKLSSLKKLELYKNSLKKLPDAIGNLKYLIKLDLSINQLSSIPQTVGEMKNLEVLDLGYNNLEDIPKSLNNLESVQKLKLPKNPLYSFTKLISLTKESISDGLFNLAGLLIENLEKIAKKEYMVYSQKDKIKDLKSQKDFALNYGISIFKLKKDIESLADIKLSKVKKFDLNLGGGFIISENKITGIRINRSKLRKLPARIGKFSSLKRLELPNNNLDEIPNSIVNLKSLKKLDLSNNKFSHIPETIGKLKALEYLDLSLNNLKSLPESIKNLQLLQTLILDSKSLENFKVLVDKLKKNGVIVTKRFQSVAEENSIKDLESLANTKLSEVKNLDYNRKVGYTLSKKKITGIKMEGCELKNLPDSLFKLSFLKRLVLYRNKLSNITESIGNLENLEYLDLRENHLKNLPESMKRLESLTTLGLGGNKFKNLPDSICNLKKLEILHLGINNFIHFPENVTELHSLRKLYLHGNKISNIPESIENLTNLKHLDLSRNNLETLPDSITQKLLKKLKNNGVFVRE
ncbi:MAG: hypothetical protein GF311_25405, partial [Candidatus Lokiarchaeota archaeon]|nr:hypothetical protein [Candidatus Lokiarchaeota archaeon]